MAKYEVEALLRALAVHTAQEDQPETVEPAVLDAYRRGEFDAGAAAALEIRLASSQTARRALVARGSESVRPPAHVRAAVLASIRPARNRTWWSLAAAAIFVLTLLGVQVLHRGRASLPPFEISALDPSAVRGAPGADFTANNTVSLPADDPLLLLVRPTWDSVPGTELGLYRRLGTVIERVDERPWVVREAPEDAGRFLVDSAAMLVGDRPGSRTIWVVAAWRGELPERLELRADSSDDAAFGRLADGGRRQPHPIVVTITPAISSPVL